MRRALIIVGFLLAALVLGTYFIAQANYLPHEQDTEVIIYTTSWCPYCEALRNTLNSYQIPFTERDVEQTWSGRIGYQILNGKGVPVSVIGAQIIHGYDGQTITDALIDAGYSLEPNWPEEDP